VKAGALRATPGNTVDYDFIKAQVLSDMSLFQVAFAGDSNPPKGQGGLAIDAWNANEMLTWAKKMGIPVVEFPQTMPNLCSPSAELERMVLSNGIHHGNHPLLREHAKVVAVMTDSSGNIKPVKDKSTKRIDGIVAGIMAIGIAIKDLGDGGPSVYETRGLLMV
jgi:phage terminase large subunit-like protein